MIEMSQVRIVIDDWEKVYHHDFHMGKWTTITGVSGAGKTTLLRALCGLVSSESGVIRIQGKPVEHLECGHRNISMAFQHNSLFPHLKIKKNLMLSLHDRDLELKEKVELTECYLEGMGLSESLLSHFPSQVSGGELSRLNIVAALLRGKNILLLDEPLASLNREYRVNVVNFLRQIQHREGFTVLCSSHQTEELQKISDYWVSV